MGASRSEVGVANAARDGAALGGSRSCAPYRCARLIQSLLPELPDEPLELLLDELPELLLEAGVLAGVDVDELPDSLLDDPAAGVLAAADELSAGAAFDDELEPPRLSVL